jgi:hypothetical protein
MDRPRAQAALAQRQARGRRQDGEIPDKIDQAAKASRKRCIENGPDFNRRPVSHLSASTSVRLHGAPGVKLLSTAPG